jgi:RTX calcium-binding nonapeptide repeat (4 copies)
MAKPIKFLFGDDTANTLNGTNYGESIFGLAANDILSAWGGNDDVFGGNGNDIVNGGKGNDRLFGEAGNDTLVGEDGNDTLLGGDGDDVLLGGRGGDVFDGGAGSDKFLISRGDGVDTIRNFASTDRIDLGAFHFDSAQAVLDAFKQVGHNAALDLGLGNQLILENIKVSDLSASQFNVSPYLVPTHTGISVTSLLTVGDHVGDYTMAGIPDGLGAFDNGDGTFTVLMNHEIGTTPGGVPLGAVRAHGAAGAFVSEWVFDKTTLEVKSGHDLIQDVFTYDATSHSYVEHNATLGNGVAFNRFCSADLADQSAFYNAVTGLGYDGGRLFLNGEESGLEGRAFAHIASGAEAGNSYELAWLGNMAYENVVANAHTGDKTVVAMMDDGQNGQVYFYAGDKKATGSAIDQAGLTGGHLFGIQVTDFAGAADNNAPNSLTPLGADESSAFTMIDLGDVSGLTGAQIDATSEAAGVTSFLRPEDGAWDTLNPNRFYFVTTNAIDKPTQLWAADFTDASNPALGGTIKLLVRGDENGADHPLMFDNITVDAQGRVTLCEDVGNDAHLGKVWQYDPTTDALSQLAQHDASRFQTGGANFLTQDEEASGVIDVSHILGNAGENVYLIDTQAHFAVGGELVEGGQLQLIHQTLV